MTDNDSLFEAKNKKPCSNEFPIKILYIVALIVWIIIIVKGRFVFQADRMSKIILLLPIVVFLINLFFIFENDGQRSGNNKANLITIYVIIIGVLINLRNPKDKKHKLVFRKKFVLALVISFFFLILGNVEISTLKNCENFENHFTLIINTYCLSLMGYAMIEFFFAEYGAIKF